MCLGCWEQYGKSTVINEKTEAALALVKQVYAQPNGGAGGGLHCVLDDWNLEDEHILFSLSDKGYFTLTELERRCAQAFMDMTLEERASTLAQDWESDSGDPL